MGRPSPGPSVPPDADTTVFCEVGVIHGRFQVLHNDHLRYLLAGKACCRHLVIGITNPDPTLTEKEDADLRRSRPGANPLTYYERCRMTTAAMIEAGIEAADFSVVPFPIHYPERYGHYVPLDGLFFLTIYDDWGRRKLEYFRSVNLKTHILWEVSPEQKGLSSETVRRLMAGKGQWEPLVPRSAAGLLNRWKIPERLYEMKKNQENP